MAELVPAGSLHSGRRVSASEPHSHVGNGRDGRRDAASRRFHHAVIRRQCAAAHKSYGSSCCRHAERFQRGRHTCFDFVYWQAVRGSRSDGGRQSVPGRDWVPLEETAALYLVTLVTRSYLFTRRVRSKRRQRRLARRMLRRKIKKSFSINDNVSLAPLRCLR